MMDPRPILIPEIEATGRLDRCLLRLLAEAPSPETDALLAWRLLGVNLEPGRAPALTSNPAVARERLLRPYEEAVASASTDGTWWALVSVPRRGRRPSAPERDIWRWPNGDQAVGRGSTEAAAICAAVLAARTCEAAALCALCDASPALAGRLDYLGACLRPGERGEGGPTMLSV